MRCVCESSGRTVGPARASEAYLIAARMDQILRLVVPEQLPTGLVETQSAADYPVYLPACWEVAKVRDCHFVPYGPSLLVPRPRGIVVNLVSADRVGESPAPQRSGPSGSTTADAASGPKRAKGPALGRDGDPRPDLAPTREFPRDVSGRRETSSAERARTPDREARPPRARPVSPGPDRAPAPAAKDVKSYQITEYGNFIQRLPSSNSCLTAEELCELQDLLHEFRDRLTDGTRPLSASNLLEARLDTSNTPPISFSPRRLFPAMREVV